MKKQTNINTKGIHLKKLIEKSLQQNASSTSSIIFYQPIAPNDLKKFAKKHNVK